MAEVLSVEVLSPAGEAFEEIMDIFENGTYGTYDNWQEFNYVKSSIVDGLTAKDLEELRLLLWQKYLDGSGACYLTKEVIEQFIKPKPTIETEPFVFPTNETLQTALIKLEALEKRKNDFRDSSLQAESDQETLRGVIRDNLTVEEMLNLVSFCSPEELAVSLAHLRFLAASQDDPVMGISVIQRLYFPELLEKAQTIEKRDEIQKKEAIFRAWINGLQASQQRKSNQVFRDD